MDRTDDVDRDFRLHFNGNEPIWPSIRKILKGISIVLKAPWLVSEDVAFEKIESEELVDLGFIEVDFLVIYRTVVFINEAMGTCD